MVFSPDDQLQSYLSRVFGEALGVYGKRAGFRWRSVANLSVAQPDATGNFPARWLPPQGGPDGIPLHEAYPEIFPDDQD